MPLQEDVGDDHRGDHGDEHQGNDYECPLEQPNASMNDRCLFTYTEIASIPEKQPNDVQKQVRNVKYEDSGTERVRRQVQISCIGFSRYSTESVDHPSRLPEINQTPDAECPACGSEKRSNRIADGLAHASQFTYLLA